VFRFNYSHDAIAEGHELKSRASFNFILYNRIPNESSVDSRTIDLPNGGTSVIVGNIIEQGAYSANNNIVGYGLEGLTNNAPHKLFCSNNTFINKKANGSFIQVANGMDTFFVKNNIFAGPKPGGLFIGTPVVLDSSNNAINNSPDAFGFADASGYDYHLLPDAPVMDKGTTISRIVNGYTLHPYLQYKDTCSFEPRAVNGQIDIGAFEFAEPLLVTDLHPFAVDLFPNPAEEVVQIDLGDKVYDRGDAWLISNTGVVVLKHELQSGKNQMQISGLAGGIYFVFITLDNQTVTKKIIIR
jgi:hypothetical protein